MIAAAAGLESLVSTLQPLAGLKELRQVCHRNPTQFQIPIGISLAPNSTEREFSSFSSNLPTPCRAIGSSSGGLRPTPTLFVLLKMRRLSEQDLEDCRAVLAKARDEQMHLDVERLRTALGELAPTEDTRLIVRRDALKELLIQRT